MNQMKKLMKQAQQMQARMLEMQKRLEEDTVEASAGGGAVLARVNGRNELLEVKIRKDAIDPEDPETLEDLVVTAVREAQRRAAERLQEEMNKVTGGMDMGGLF